MISSLGHDLVGGGGGEEERERGGILILFDLPPPMVATAHDGNAGNK